MAKAKRGGRTGKASQFIVSDERAPKIPLRPGMRVNVQSVKLVDPQLRAIKKRIAARLCGGSGTCLALVDVGPGKK